MGITTSHSNHVAPRKVECQHGTAALPGRAAGLRAHLRGHPDLLKAQKQATWRESHRVAHEIKILSLPSRFRQIAFRQHRIAALLPIQRKLKLIRHCSETIASSVDTVRTLVDEFWPCSFSCVSSQPGPALTRLWKRSEHVQWTPGRDDDGS
jgi:hypothetical protein